MTIHYRLYYCNNYSSAKANLDLIQTACKIHLPVASPEATRDFSLVTCAACISYWDVPERVIDLLDTARIPLSRVHEYSESTLMSIPRFGRKALNDVVDYLSVRGLTLLNK